MERGTIEREIHVQASPEVVFDVISKPEHLARWWPDQADLEPRPGAVGVIRFGQAGDAAAHVVPLTVLEMDRPRRFTFRWNHPADEAATPSNSLLVTFDLEPTDTGTTLRFTESGFRERGWAVAVLEAQYADHVQGWAHFLPRLVGYVDRLVATP